MSTPLDRASEALRRHGLGRWAPPAPWGNGLDHVVFRAGDLAVRVGRDVDVTHESELLAVLAAADLGVAVPCPVLVEAELAVLAYPLLPGAPLLGQPPPQGSATTLARALRRLHRVNAATVAGLVPREIDPGVEWLADLHGPVEHLDLLHATVPDPPEHPVLCHNDLGAEHLLADGGELTGILDWSDAAITDPAIDLSRLLRDFGPRFLDEVLDGYGDLGGDAMPRIYFYARCAALEDLAHARATGRAEYAVAARPSLTWLFPG
ncbi:phosphotransferase [Rhodococcus sp. X156]|uniref:phosphotransferase n=1 Tax=Rhodococcus sp. X156 TaxID=2499145 RepID=UPI0013E31B2C|nr:phosphotransferase [Rhodococcus sp. X156]